MAFVSSTDLAFSLLTADFSGDVLSCYLEEVKYLHPLDPESDNSEALHRTYMKLSKLASDQIKLDAIARTCETSMLDLSTVLKPLASQEAFMTSIRRVISSMSSASILKDHGGQWNTFKALKKRAKMMMDRLEGEFDSLGGSANF